MTGWWKKVGQPTQLLCNRPTSIVCLTACDAPCQYLLHKLWSRISPVPPVWRLFWFKTFTESVWKRSLALTWAGERHFPHFKKNIHHAFREMYELYRYTYPWANHIFSLFFLSCSSTDDYRLCCLFDNAEVCTAAQQSHLDSCTRLMPNTVLRVAMWILGFGALIGNSAVLVIRFRSRRDRGSREQFFFISNLAMADWIMGIYMIIIASADVYYGKYYFLYAPIWRESALCRFTGTLAILSSESSVFMLTIITVDRFMCVVFPFSKLRFTTKSSRICVVVLWLVTFLMALVPIVVGSFVTGFYGLSDVCIGLPLSLANTDSGSLVWSHELSISVYVVSASGHVQPSWIYSIILFLVINFACFIFILLCYVIIFIRAKRSAKEMGEARHDDAARDKEVRMALKMALIVGTDFICWMPVIIMGILSQSGFVTLPVSLYAWCAVFILPINASLNPYLYTFVAYAEKRKRKLKNRESTMTVSSTITESKKVQNSRLWRRH